ncbi:putative cobalt transport permease, CbiQ family [Treponema primitia ZAS-2]|uniref:Putative ABC-type transport protein n=1 Tax=Treponema primitia (strain ATCC BAA-887 / DSM 12427 / ZAS-2) TaxID=545694 RepID=D8L132_TREPZ|nr:energy-coupling factor transporter transmembrane component T [Treponema primitia]ADJ19576.1 putative ABC-type transport protein [Treponema primitia ZAS-2]AEF83974.1 putative cobalt transport permease, CbiQ family [Treponema primitia ZAS-2]
MKNLLILLLFLGYTFIVFFTSNYYILGAYCLINIFVMILVHVKVKPALRYTAGILPFIIFAAAINFFLEDTNTALLFFIRLLVVCNVTHSFKYILSTTQLANAIETLFYPLKLFRVNPKDISLMICICIAFIPVLSRELEQIKQGLQAKGMEMRIKNVKYVLKPFLYGVFKRTDEISDALRAKAYME